MDTGTTDLDAAFTENLLFHQLHEYPWDQDEEFQGGLRAILGSVQDPRQVDHLTMRAKCYYFARKAGTPVDFDGYKNWIETQRTTEHSGDNAANEDGKDIAPSATTTANSANSIQQGSTSGAGGFGNASKPASFSEICDMIAEGKPIPGIKEIPGTILEGQASESSTERRRKPWEKAEEETKEEAARPSWMT